MFDKFINLKCKATIFNKEEKVIGVLRKKYGEYFIDTFENWMLRIKNINKNDYLFKIEPHTICQYTGFKNKFNSEIFDNDYCNVILDKEDLWGRNYNKMFVFQDKKDNEWKVTNQIDTFLLKDLRREKII